MMNIYMVKSSEGYPDTILTHDKHFTQYQFESIRATIQFELGHFLSYGEVVEQLIHRYGFTRVSSITI
jgi:hypothetical protein